MKRRRMVDSLIDPGKRFFKILQIVMVLCQQHHRPQRGGEIRFIIKQLGVTLFHYGNFGWLRVHMNNLPEQGWESLREIRFYELNEEWFELLDIDVA